MLKTFKMNSLYFLLCILSLVIVQISSENSLSYENFININQIKSISNYAESNGFPHFDTVFTAFKVLILAKYVSSIG